MIKKVRINQESHASWTVVGGAPFVAGCGTAGAALLVAILAGRGQLWPVPYSVDFGFHYAHVLANYKCLIGQGALFSSYALDIYPTWPHWGAALLGLTLGSPLLGMNAI